MTAARIDFLIGHRNPRTRCSVLDRTPIQSLDKSPPSHGAISQVKRSEPFSGRQPAQSLP
jgi:hypothetical protein